MNTISDNDLILYVYRDGLDPARIAEIDAALAASAGLRERLAVLQATLTAVDAGPLPEPDAGFTDRLWRRLDARIEREAPRRRRGWLTQFHELLLALALPRFAVAATALLAVAVGLGYWAGRSGGGSRGDANASASVIGARVLDAYVAEHLRAT
jgi:anti-sigma factor RsiW